MDADRKKVLPVTEADDLADDLDVQRYLYLITSFPGHFYMRLFMLLFWVIDLQRKSKYFTCCMLSEEHKNCHTGSDQLLIQYPAFNGPALDNSVESARNSTVGRCAIICPHKGLLGYKTRRATTVIQSDVLPNIGHRASLN